MAKSSKGAPRASKPSSKTRNRQIKQDRRGRPDHKPFHAARQLVETLAGYGMAEEDIAKLVPRTELPAGADPNTQILGIDPKTLRKYYRDQLDLGALKAEAATRGTLHRMANGAPAQFVRAEQLPNVSALIFTCKTRLGMIETNKLIGDPSAPLANVRMSDLTDAQLAELAARLARKPA
jgi:hypothetical protein